MALGKLPVSTQAKLALLYFIRNFASNVVTMSYKLCQFLLANYHL